jgi:DNA-directed RNA polymerase subunit RPC12/RpoP
MKFNLLRSLFATALLGLLASSAFAGPGPQFWQNLHDQQQFKTLKTGDKIAYVCNQCKTVSVVTVDSPEKAMELCKEGASVACPSCKMETKVVLKRQRNDPPNHTEVSYVNEKGEECMFIAKVADTK